MTSHSQDLPLRHVKHFHRKMREALVRKGWIIPENAEEVAWAEEALESETTEVPKDALSTSRLMERLNAKMNNPESVRIVHLGSSHERARVEEGLAYAAREGGELSDEVRKAMDRDRREAERKADESAAEESQRDDA